MSEDLTQRSWRRSRHGALLAVACCLVASSCGAATERTASASIPATSDTSTTSTTITATTTAIAADDQGESYVAPEGWRIVGQREVSTALLHRDGISIEVPFVGGPKLEPSDPCAANYGITLTENSEEVRVAVFELSPSSPDDVPDNYVCTSQGHGWRLGATLAEPLDGRTFIDDLTGEQAPLVDLATVLLPTDAPTGWSAMPPQVVDGQLEQYYTNPASPAALLFVWSSPIGETSSIDSLRSRDQVQIDELTVRSMAAIEVRSLEDGAVTIAWEEGDRLYQVHGYQVDPAQLLAMAEGMQ